MLSTLRTIGQNIRIHPESDVRLSLSLNIPKPYRALYFDLDGVLVDHPAEGHNRLDYQRVKTLRDLALARRYGIYGESYEKSRAGHEAAWSTKDPYNVASTDLSFVLSILQKQFRTGLADHRLHTLARGIIKETDEKYRLRAQQLPHGETYEHEPKLIDFVRRFHTRYPDVPLLVNSGNSKKMAREKILALGLHNEFMKNGDLPDYPIYGEDVMERGEAVRWIRENLLTGRTGSEVLFCDRPADPFALRLGWENNDYYVYFNNRPDFTLPEYNRPTIWAALKEADNERRVLYLPPGESPSKNVGRLDHAFHIERAGHPPENLPGLRK